MLPCCCHYQVLVKSFEVPVFLTFPPRADGSCLNLAVDLTVAFDTVTHNVLLSKIARLMLPEATF